MPHLNWVHGFGEKLQTLQFSWHNGPNSISMCEGVTAFNCIVLTLWLIDSFKILGFKFWWWLYYCRHIHVSLIMQREKLLTWRDGGSSALSVVQSPTKLAAMPRLQNTRLGIPQAGGGLAKLSRIWKISETGLEKRQEWSKTAWGLIMQHQETNPRSSIHLLVDSRVFLIPGQARKPLYSTHLIMWFKDIPISGLGFSTKINLATFGAWEQGIICWIMNKEELELLMILQYLRSDQKEQF